MLPATYSLLIAGLLLNNAAGQNSLGQQVLSTVIYTTYGDRTPFVLPQSPTLTPLGAQQLYKAGSRFRARYVTPIQGPFDELDTTIRNISPYQINNDEITILSTDKQYVSASAQAFMQGMYPPLASPGSANYTYISGQSPMANGTNMIAPLDGFQYANIETASANDIDSIWLQGAVNCPSYGLVSSQYYDNPTFSTLQTATSDFYDSLQPEFLDGLFSDASVGYFDAYYIYDYLRYAVIHNDTIADNLDVEDLTTAEVLATDWVHAMWANTSASGITEGDHIGLIAGRSLATRILQAFYTTINTQGESDKLTLLFGSYEPMISFAALASLITEQHSAFVSLPPPGSSYAFELIALRDNDIGNYPDSTEMFVRFNYMNGTEDDAQLVPYPLFGRSPSATLIPLSEFIAGMQRIMINNVEEWCKTCDSFSIFCPAFTEDFTALGKKNPGHGKVSPVIGGVIGALVSLIVAGLVFAAVMLLGGCRFHRVSSSRRSELGGFKGSERLASDQDLTIPKGGAGATIVEPEVFSPATRGHERVGSWELREQAKAEEAQQDILSKMPQAVRRPSYEDDDLNKPAAKPHDHVYGK